MMMKRILFFCMITCGVALLFSSCEKSVIDLGSTKKAYDPGAPVDSVKFKTDVVPMLDSDCCVCHGTGGQAPCFEESVAYNNIVSNSLVDVANPSASLIYVHITENPNHHGGGIHASSGDLLLQWISQGALNN